MTAYVWLAVIGRYFQPALSVDADTRLHPVFLCLVEVDELDPVPALALIDGNRSTGIKYPCRTVIKGDASCADIAAASILAKVTRDRYMTDLSEEYPGYGFEKHKGYGTAAHYEAIRQLGPCPAHRMSFLKKMH